MNLRTTVGCNLVFLLGATGLAACAQTPGFDWVSEEPTDKYGADISVTEGSCAIIIPYTLRDEMAGGASLHKVDDIRSDDPRIVRLAFTTHEFDYHGGKSALGVVVYGVRPGDTQLRLFNGGDDEGTLSVHVEPRGR